MARGAGDAAGGEGLAATSGETDAVFGGDSMTAAALAEAEAVCGAPPSSGHSCKVKSQHQIAC